MISRKISPPPPAVYPGLWPSRCRAISGSAFCPGALIAFQQRWPEIQLTVDFDDRRVDLESGNYDLSIRISADPAPLRIGSMRHHLVAGPGYFATRNPPQTLDDLRDHKLLYYGRARRAIWRFGPDDPPFDFAPFLNSNNGVFLRDAACAVLGIAHLPDFIVGADLAAGRLVPVLPHLPRPSWGIYLVHGETRRLNRRVRLIAEAMTRACDGRD